MSVRWRLFAALILLLGASPVTAEPAPFDLVGPTLAIHVTHGDLTLPISETPNLAVGDQISIKADFPPGQSVHYELIAAFLRGATNPPPEKWFSRAETWTRKGREGLKITVPPEAQQVLVFLAPQTGGDFKTLMDAVRGRPGAFVRASQDLIQASLDRSRLDAFVAAIRKVDKGSAEELKTVSPLLARSLTIKLNADCLQKIPELQAACLMQGQDGLVLNDGHSTSTVQALTSGDSAELIQQLSAAPQAGYGLYGPYVGAIMDIARILDSFGTAQYQYIPALATARDDKLLLVLNTAPSFHNPMSVLVAALPPIQPAQPPSLTPVDPDQAYCLQNPNLVLAVEGAPLAFSTAFAHGLALQLKSADGKTVEVPVSADAEKGGLVLDAAALPEEGLDPSMEAALHGYWGFAPFEGPHFRVETAHDAHWTLDPEDVQSLISGRDDQVRLQAPDAACVQGVFFKGPGGDLQPAPWKLLHANQLQVDVPLKDVPPGPFALVMKRYGGGSDQTDLEAFSQEGRLDSLDYHMGDAAAVLKGTRLDEVSGLTLRGQVFKPQQLVTTAGSDVLTLTPADPGALSKLHAGENLTAKVGLKDGRTVNLKTSIGAARPSVTLLAKSVAPDPSHVVSPVQLTDKEELPQGAVLTFSVHAVAPKTFSGHDMIEIGGPDGTVLATLTLRDGLILEDQQVELAKLDTGKAFTGPAFGPLRFRTVEGGVEGEWQPLAVLVRLPSIRQLKCSSGRLHCELSGGDLFLLDSVSADPDFNHMVKVPEGFTGSTLVVPHPSAGRLYVKLRDAPTIVNLLDAPA